MKSGQPIGDYADDAPSVPQVEFATALPVAIEKDGEGRLRADLREAALRFSPCHSIAESAKWIVKTGGQGVRARAFAALAVTGRRSAAAFEKLDHGTALREAALEELGPNALPAEKTAVDTAIGWARKIKAWIDSDAATRDARWNEVRALYPNEVRPWIAVSGEDDLPRRPLNISRTRRAERDLTLKWKTPYAANGELTTTVRFAASASLDDPKGPPMVLCLHGLGSRLEESELLSIALEPHGIGTIALDLPNHAYSERIPFDRLNVDMRTTGGRNTSAIALDMMEVFVDSFAQKLIADHPALEGRLIAVAGGSLGGSLSLRLGVRKPSWLERSIAWSPGNAWRSFWFSDNFHLAAVDADAVGVQPIERVAQDESPGSRVDYIKFVFDDFLPTTNHPLWHTWWRGGDYEPARVVHARDARVLRHEVYDRWHRRWCCALAHDQLAVTMRGPHDDAPHGEWKFDHIGIPVLLMSGSADNYPFANIFDATKTLAKRAEGAAPVGVARFFDNTGHSIHDERPKMLAKNIAAFLKAPGAFG